MLYAECGDRLTDAGADRAKARALAAQPNLAVVGGNGGSRADRAKARALATQPNLAGVSNACGGRTDFHGNFQLMLIKFAAPASRYSVEFVFSQSANASVLIFLGMALASSLLLLLIWFLSLLLFPAGRRAGSPTVAQGAQVPV